MVACRDQVGELDGDHPWSSTFLGIVLIPAMPQDAVFFTFYLGEGRGQCQIQRIPLGLSTI